MSGHSMTPLRKACLFLLLAVAVADDATCSASSPGCPSKMQADANTPLQRRVRIGDELAPGRTDEEEKNTHTDEAEANTLLQSRVRIGDELAPGRTDEEEKNTHTDKAEVKYQPCAGKHGEMLHQHCNLCPLNDEECVETAELKICMETAVDHKLECKSVPTKYTPCAGKEDLETCTWCAPWESDCTETAVVKTCLSGECQSGKAAGAWTKHTNKGIKRNSLKMSAYDKGNSSWRNRKSFFYDSLNQCKALCLAEPTCVAFVDQRTNKWCGFKTATTSHNTRSKDVYTKATTTAEEE